MFLARGYEVLIRSAGLLQGLRLPPHMPVLDLEPRLRCRSSGAPLRSARSILIPLVLAFGLALVVMWRFVQYGS